MAAKKLTGKPRCGAVLPGQKEEGSWKCNLSTGHDGAHCCRRAMDVEVEGDDRASVGVCYIRLEWKVDAKVKAF